MNMCGGKLEADHKASSLNGDEKPNDFVGWKDFPKGLKVLLLLHGDETSTAEIKAKLENMDYIVFLLNDENEALEAISNKTDNFHVAIVEVDTKDSNNTFRFLQMARGLPTIMISSVHCLSTMMKCIALGAAEFLQKPLSEEKLKNIWQHVVHKAFNAGSNALSKSLEPIKETVSSMFSMESENVHFEIDNCPTPENNDGLSDQSKEHGVPMVVDRFTEPSTPKQEQGDRLPESGNCREKKHFNNSGDQMFSCSDTKSVDNTNLHSAGDADPSEHVSMRVEATEAEEEVNSVKETKKDENYDPKECSMLPVSKHGANKVPIKSHQTRKTSSTRCNMDAQNRKSNKKRMKGSKVDWTPELHRRFVQAVDQLGIDQAIPSKILDLMKVEGLTRHNVASHLQKYRMNKRHILPKDDVRRWPQHRDPPSRVYPHKPLVAFPPVHPNYGFVLNQGYHVWGHPTCYPSNGQRWGHNGYQTWQPSAGAWPWKSFNRMCADAWGCPALSQDQPFSTQANHTQPLSYYVQAGQDHYQTTHNLYDVHVGDKVIDEVVKEAISKPWLPLPLGLKPPSTDTIIAELHRQGIRSIPPSSTSCR